MMFPLRLQRKSNKTAQRISALGMNMLDPNDPHQYLETELRIIAENETHVVVAHRVEKAYIARNLLFLAALSDHVSGKEVAATSTS